MDGRIGHATTSYSANYSQPSYATPHVSNFSAPYETVDVHNSAPHLHGHSRISENSIGSHVSSPRNVTYNVFPAQLQNFDDISLPKEPKNLGGNSIQIGSLRKILRIFGTNAMLFYMNY